MNAPARNILVTGGTGFIGSAVVRRLVADGHSVRVVDNDLRGSASRLDDLKGQFELVQCDVRDLDAMTNAARGCDILLHLAALNGTENFYQRPDLVLDVGVRGMYAALDAAKAAGVREFVLASSSEAYQTAPTIPTPEDVPLMIPDPWNPRFSYGGSKLISEIMLANYHRDFFERAVCFRPHNVYGPDMGWEHVIPQFALRVHDAAEAQPGGVLPIPIQGDGSQTRAFIYIDDFVDGLMLIMFKGEHRNTYHIGTMDEATTADVIRLVAASLGREIEIQSGELPEGSTQRRCPDVSKLMALGFAPRTSLADGIAITANWYTENAARRPARRDAA
jgi:nucleoside-diphosphate-sugar epimerase